MLMIMNNIFLFFIQAFSMKQYCDVEVVFIKMAIGLFLSSLFPFKPYMKFKPGNLLDEYRLDIERYLTS